MRGALEHLHRKVRRERHDLARHEGVVAARIPRRRQRRAGEERRQVEGHQGVEDDDLVRGVGVERLPEGEVGRVVVVRLVERRVGGRVRVGEARDELLEVALALGGGDGGAGPVVVVETLVG